MSVPISTPRVKFLRSRLGRAAAALTLGATLAACQTTTQDYQPPVTVPAAFSTTGESALPEKWWLSFDDPVLDRLVEQALSGNLTVRAAWDRLAQAEATAKKAGADLYPTLDGEAGVSGSRQRASTTSGRKEISNDTNLSLGLSSSYEIDLWGEIRSTRDAAQYDLSASREDVRTAAITLSAEIAATWYQLVEKYGQIDLLQSQVETNEQVLDLTTLRFQRGQVSATDVLQQQQLVESSRGSMIVAQSQARVLEHRLAVLLGRSPTEIEVPRINALATLPALPDAGLPADLVRRRPDIRKAHFAVLAADRRTAAAVADRFPRLTLNASLSTSGDYLRDLFSNWIGTLAANLAAPLFDAGLRKAEVERTRAVTAEALNDYGQTVLEALQEVEDALVQERHQRRYLDSLEKQIELSDRSLERIRDTYINGGADYLKVLDALLTNQSLERTHLEAQRTLIEYRIDLCKAIGGGWEMDDPTESGTAGKSNDTQAQRHEAAARQEG